MKVTVSESIFRFAHGVPEPTVNALRRYYLRGLNPGSFLVAILNNDLRGACEQANDLERHRLFEIVQFLFVHAPADSWGRPDAAEQWIERFHEEVA